MKQDVILCKVHNVPKVPMRNKRNAPVLGCPQCHPQTASEDKPKPSPAPKPAPVKAAKSKRAFSLFGLARGR